MSRITCKTPASAKPLSISVVDLGTGWVSIAEAPDFSVPDTANTFAERDPDDNDRAIRPGEVYILTPLAARNKSTATTYIDVKLVTETNIEVNFGRVSVPPSETSFIPLQGRSLLKRVSTATFGDRLFIRAQTTSVFDVWMAAEEKLSSEHIGVVNG